MDYWPQRLTGRSVPWIPAHNRRLLHPNMLMVLLRCTIGADTVFKSGSNYRVKGLWLVISSTLPGESITKMSACIPTGPQPRKNRLDFAMLSEDFRNALYGDSRYFQPKGADDHLAHTMTSRFMFQPHRHGCWRILNIYLTTPILSLPSLAKPSRSIKS